MNICEPAPIKNLFNDSTDLPFLNQARWPVAGMCLVLKIVSVQISVCMCVFACVCVPPRPLITSGMISTLYDSLNKFYSCFMQGVVIIDDECHLSVKVSYEPT